MASNYRKHYLFASDFDQTLTFNDTGYVLSELLGISVKEFERKAKGMAKLNLVQQGAELSYLLLHDPEFHSRVRRDDLFEVGKRIRLKDNIKQVYEILDRRIDGFHFDFYVLSAAPVEVIQSALEGIVPQDHIFGTEFKYKASGEIESLVRATAGYGKVTRLDQLEEDLGIPADHIVYVGDGSSDIHVMLHVNRRDGSPLRSRNRNWWRRSRSGRCWATTRWPRWCRFWKILPVGSGRRSVQLFESYGFLIQGWDHAQTDWVTLRPSGVVAAKMTAADVI
jgi:HAD superfamily phosphoserine phosphatase-like hydrolase